MLLRHDLGHAETFEPRIVRNYRVAAFDGLAEIVGAWLAAPPPLQRAVVDLVAGEQRIGRRVREIGVAPVGLQIDLAARFEIDLDAHANAPISVS
ncbi:MULTISPECIES: hypothetical protein [unclassified Mesorhizobium]|uniref:hypothetical protein n=1 Tax=unclassified Mesorhizobium TaxID=325217 RepID=UPI00167A71F0|nr:MULTISPECIES: hypothetical protein [unclassified Mesorhizobium]